MRVLRVKLALGGHPTDHIHYHTIGAVHRQFRKLTKTKGAFPNQDITNKKEFVQSAMCFIAMCRKTR